MLQVLLNTEYWWKMPSCFALQHNHSNCMQAPRHQQLCCLLTHSLLPTDLYHSVLLPFKRAVLCHKDHSLKVHLNVVYMQMLFTCRCCLHVGVVYMQVLFTCRCCLHVGVVYMQMLFTCNCCLQPLAINDTQKMYCSFEFRLRSYFVALLVHK